VIHRLQSYRLFIELTSATILDFKGSRPNDRSRESSKSQFVRQRQRLHEPSSSDRSRRNPERADKQQPRTRHRTKLGTQWDRSGLRPTWGHDPIPIGGDTRKRHYHHSISTGRYSEERTSLPIP